MDVVLKDATSSNFYLLVKVDSVSLPAFPSSTELTNDLIRRCEPAKPHSWREALSILAPTLPEASEEIARQQLIDLLNRKKLCLRIDCDSSSTPLTLEGMPRNRGGAPGGKGTRTSASQGSFMSEAENGVSHGSNSNLGPAVADKSAKEGPEVNSDLSGDFSTSGPAKVTADSEVGSTPIADTPTEGCPISMVSGEEVLQLNDFALPGPIQFEWCRTYRSGHSRNIGLGCGWTHIASDRLEASDKDIHYFDDEGRQIRFARPALNGKSQYLPEGLTLECVSENSFVLSQHSQVDKVFQQLGNTNTYRLIQLRHQGYKPSISGVREQQGYCIDLLYNAQNSLVKIAGNWGKYLLLHRDRLGYICKVELGSGSQKKCVAEYEYSSEGDLITQKNAAGVGEKYEYKNHLFTRRTLVTGFSYYYEWDVEDNKAKCLRNWGDNGIYNYRFEWDSQNKISKAVDSLGFTRIYFYNSFGQIIKKIDSEGGEHRYQYHDGRKTAYTDPEGNTTRYYFDTDNNPVGECDALGNRASMSYFKGKITGYRSKDKAQWRYEYNTGGLLESTKDPLGQITKYHYNPDGLIQRVVDPQGRSTEYRWNDNAELKTIITAQGIERHFNYDAWGQITEAQTKLNNKLKNKLSGGTANTDDAPMTRFQYNLTGQLTRVVAPNNEVTSYSYNNNDQLVRHRDSTGRVTEFKYDGLSQIVQRVDSAGNNLNYEYDKERNLSALINENGERYTFYYDGNERLVKEIGFDGRIQHYKYNKAGHLIKHMDAGNIFTEFERDPLGRMLTKTSRSIKRPELPEERCRYVYDAMGRLSETYNREQYLAFEYNSLGTLTREHHSDLNNQMLRVKKSMVNIRYGTRPEGLRESIRLPDGQFIEYCYDENNNLSGVKWNGRSVSELERDVLGREITRQQGELVTYSDYDPMGRLQRQVTANRTNKIHQPILREYAYDQNGNLSHYADGEQQTRYVYDLLDRLNKVELQIGENKSEEYFDFDPAGNLLQQREKHQSQPSNQAARQTNVKGNRLLFQGDRKFEYDERGNLIKECRGKNGKLVTRYTYNLQNQLVKIHKGGQSTSYQYDSLGRRVRKQDEFGETNYLWAGDQLVQESRNNIKRAYLYEPESFRPLAMVENDELYHYHLDHLGTPKELSDEQGKIVWKAQYKTYGNLAVKEVEQVENNLRFQGQYFDEESGLHYNRHRYYNPSIGQFISQDPIGLLGGVNNYQYAPNPTGWVDPFGLTCREQMLQDALNVLKKHDSQIKAVFGDHVGYGIRGSLATGIRHSGGEFDSTDFDVDAFIVDNKMGNIGRPWAVEYVSDTQAVLNLQESIEKDLMALPGFEGLRTEPEFAFQMRRHKPKPREGAVLARENV